MERTGKGVLLGVALLLGLLMAQGCGSSSSSSPGSDQRPPVFQALEDRSVNEGELLSFAVSASHPDGEPVTVQAVPPLPEGATFSLGAFRWTPTFDQAGQYDVTFTAFALGRMVAETVFITVHDVDQAPVLAAIGNRMVDEGALLQFTVSASDPDGDAVTITVANLPGGATFDGETFSWTPALGQAGNYPVTFTAASGSPELTHSRAITISVGNVNRPPELDEIGNLTVALGDELTFTVTAVDPDTDVLSYSVSPLPAGATLASNTGLFQWTPSQAQLGNHPVTFTVSDGTLSHSQSTTITVLDALEFVQTAQGTRDVDVLFVLDTSLSMNSKREKLGNEVPLILRELVDVSRYRFAFLLGWGSPGTFGGYRGSGYLYEFNGNQSVLDSSVLSIAEMEQKVGETLRSTPPRDSATDGGEAGLYALNRLLNSPGHLQTARNEGFLNENTGLVVIFLADENDVCVPGIKPDPAEDVAREHFCVPEGVTPGAVHRKALEVVDGPVLFTGLLYLDEEQALPGGDEVGYGYLEAIYATGGVPQELGAADYTDAARNFGIAINAATAGLQYLFPLRGDVAGRVDIGSLRVWVGGVELRADQFLYDPESHSVKLGNPGKANDLIEIRYRVN